MGSIFDENSEFLDYLKKKKEKEATEPAPEELYFKATPFNSDHPTEHHEPTELHIKDESLKPEPKSAFTLDLKHVRLKDSDEDSPQVDPAITAKPEPKKIEKKLDPKISKLNTLHKKNTPTNNLAGFLWDKIKFIATTVAIFLIFFFALHWQAYSKSRGNPSWYPYYCSKN